MVTEEDEFREPPEPGTQLYQQIINAGCGLYHDEWNGDYDCLHRYGWECEVCPVAKEAYEHFHAENNGIVEFVLNTEEST